MTHADPAPVAARLFTEHCADSAPPGSAARTARRVRFCMTGVYRRRCERFQLLGPVALTWKVPGEPKCNAAAGVLTGPPHREAAHALIAGYQAAGGTLTISGPEVFAGWLVKNANWTEMHILHALDYPIGHSQVSG
jgi:hypothetical protein